MAVAIFLAAEAVVVVILITLITISNVNVKSTGTGKIDMKRMKDIYNNELDDSNKGGIVEFKKAMSYSDGLYNGLNSFEKSLSEIYKPSSKLKEWYEYYKNKKDISEENEDMKKLKKFYQKGFDTIHEYVERIAKEIQGETEKLYTELPEIEKNIISEAKKTKDCITGNKGIFKYFEQLYKALNDKELYTKEYELEKTIIKDYPIIKSLKDKVETNYNNTPGKLKSITKQQQQRGSRNNNQQQQELIKKEQEERSNQIQRFKEYFSHVSEFKKRLQETLNH